MFLNAIEEKQKGAFYSLAYHLMNCDNDCDESELALLDEYLGEMNIDKPEIISLNDAKEAFLYSSKSIRKMMFVELIALALADNDYKDEEIDYLSELGESFGITPEEAADLKYCVDELIYINQKLASLVKE